jgi:hypothetical protein
MRILALPAIWLFIFALMQVGFNLGVLAWMRIADERIRRASGSAR